MSVHPDTYYLRTARGLRERSALEGRAEADVCIVGAGLAGLTAARELARRGLSAIVLEANRVAWGASGRNGGFVEAGFAEETGRLIARAGPDRARELFALSAEGARYVRKAISALRMRDVDSKPGWLRVYRVDDEAAARRSQNQHAGVLGHELEYWPTEKVRAHLKTSRYFHGLYDPAAFHIHPLNYALALARAAETAGAAVYEQTAAREIISSGQGWRVSCPGGEVRAGHVVLCASGYMGRLYPPVSRAVLPVATYVMVTPPMGARLGEAIEATFAVTDTRRAGDYYRIVGGDRLLWGGRITTQRGEPARLGAMLARDAVSVYPQLAGLEVECAWSGLMGYALHKMPLIGEVEPGVWTATAFGGHGLNTTAMAGLLIASAIADGDDRWRLFAPFGRRWAAGLLGRAGTQGAYWWYQARDWMDERRAGRAAGAAE